MQIFKTSESLPDDCIASGDYEVWWFNAEDCSWTLGIAMLMDFNEPATLEKYTHWAHKDEIELPEEVE